MLSYYQTLLTRHSLINSQFIFELTGQQFESLGSPFIHNLFLAPPPVIYAVRLPDPADQTVTHWRPVYIWTERQFECRGTVFVHNSTAVLSSGTKGAFGSTEKTGLSISAGGIEQVHFFVSESSHLLRYTGFKEHHLWNGMLFNCLILARSGTGTEKSFK